MLSKIAVWTVLETSSFFPAPKKLAATTFVPTDRPTKRFTNKLIRELVDPTAAKEFSPANWPTTTISAALKRSCKTPEKIRGPEKRINFPTIEPDVISSW